MMLSAPTTSSAKAKARCQFTPLIIAKQRSHGRIGRALVDADRRAGFGCGFEQRPISAVVQIFAAPVGIDDDAVQPQFAPGAADFHDRARYVLGRHGGKRRIAAGLVRDAPRQPVIRQPREPKPPSCATIMEMIGFYCYVPNLVMDKMGRRCGTRVWI